MKIFLLLLLLLPFAAMTQNNKRIYRGIQFNGKFPSIHEDYFMDQYISLEKRREEKLDSVVIMMENKRGKQTKRTITFNRLGHILTTEYGRMKVTYTYQDDSLLVMKRTTTKKNVTERTYEYENGKLVGIKRRDNKKEIARYVYKYNKNGDKTESHYYFGRALKNHFVMRNEYNDKEELMKTTYFVNDELMKTLTYTCDDRGKETNKKEEKIGVCQYKEESNDGSYIKYERRLIQDKVYLYEKHYAKDSSFIGSKRWLNDTILVFEYALKEGIGESNYYSSKGKYMNGWVYKYDDNKRILSRTSYTGKKKKQRISEKLSYEKDFLSTKQRFFKGRKLADIKYKYTFRQDS